jgi:hypothetical protein
MCCGALTFPPLRTPSVTNSHSPVNTQYLPVHPAPSLSTQVRNRPRDLLWLTQALERIGPRDHINELLTFSLVK